jgi:hypothetical protein
MTATKTVVDSVLSARPFVEPNDDLYLVRQCDADDESALLINPKASLGKLLAAANSRAALLARSLNYWARVKCDEAVSGDEVASSLEPLAQQVANLLEAIADDLRKHTEKG